LAARPATCLDDCGAWKHALQRVLITGPVAILSTCFE